MTDETNSFQLAFAAALARDEAEGREDTSPEPSAEPLDTDARRIAEVVLRDPEMAALITGDSAEELLRDAHRVRKALDANQKPPPVDFDGGAREMAQPPTDPIRDHDLGVVELIRDWKYSA